ncbi:MAG: HDOD domain-containing protein [Acidobacteria bacterium]|nr:HDOD domain-containing protein [Acidobacteriota bacterium]
MQSAVLSPLDVAVQHLQHAPGPPAIGENAFALAGKLLSDQSTIQAGARIIERDLGLTLRLLRMVNSAMFNHAGRTILSVTHASALIGTDMMSQLLETVPRNAIPRPARELVVLSQIAGHFSWVLMARVEPRWTEDAFIAGLFRNMGEVMVALEQPEDYQHILHLSGGTLPGLRAGCRRHLHFDFDELTAMLLNTWSLHGAPDLAARSTPEALLAQGTQSETMMALAAALGHSLTQACFRAEDKDRDSVLRACWPALARIFRVRDVHLPELCDIVFKSVEGLAKATQVSREQLRLKPWVPEAAPEARPAEAPVVAGAIAGGATIESILRSALGHGMDRAAWLPLVESGIGVPWLEGEGWPAGVSSEIDTLFPVRKPPFLLAFSQRRDVWIDCGKDDRYNNTGMVKRLLPAAFFLLPVCEGRTVKGCLYFDWSKRRDQPPETLLATLQALRDFMAANIPLS